LLATGQDSARSLRVDDAYAYWAVPAKAHATPPDGAIRRIALSGGCPEELATGLSSVVIAVAGGRVYFHDGQSISFVPVSGGARGVLYADAGGGASAPYELAADVDALYFALADKGKVFRAPLDGSGVQTLATGLPAPLGIAVDDTTVYIANDGDATSPPYSNGSFVRVPKLPGGVVESLATVTGGQDVAVAGGHAYFLQFGFPPTNTPGAIWKLDLPGATPQKLVDPTGPGTQIETDGTSLFVSGAVVPMQAGLYRVLPDGSHTQLVSAAMGLLDVPFALGADFVVYATGGEIHRIAKP
jgi:hypothetical protein